MKGYQDFVYIRRFFEKHNSETSCLKYQISKDDWMELSQSIGLFFNRLVIYKSGNHIYMYSNFL